MQTLKTPWVCAVDETVLLIHTETCRRCRLHIQSQSFCPLIITDTRPYWNLVCCITLLLISFNFCDIPCYSVNSIFITGFWDSVHIFHCRNPRALDTCCLRMSSNEDILQGSIIMLRVCPWCLKMLPTWFLEELLGLFIGLHRWYMRMWPRKCKKKKKR